jgi:hypothetical protein
MGVDPAALIPKGRIEEVAALLAAGDASAAREIVRTLAPAALRRISRRLIADPAFRRQAEVFASAFHTALGAALAAGEAETARLLNTQPGRVHLLLDAAQSRPA